jgi:CheY-like chemotaxis protein/two-component sensor histidine kinase
MAGIGTLASGIAHEFNNLIGGMMGYAQLASATGEKEDFHKAIEVVFSSSKRAKEIITNLLTFSRRTAHETEVISLEILIRQVLTLVERDLQKSNIEIASSIDSDIKIKTDVGQVQQVLMNLVINAQHAMPNGGRLSISTALIGKEIHIRVADNGIGIPEENLSRIFEPFFTTKGSIGTGKEEGTGLGLSLSYGLIQDLGGEIRVESEVKIGSTFTVVLPYRQDEAGENICCDEGALKAKQKDCSEGSEHFQLNILVVDDDRTTLELIDQVLSREGHKVVTAPTGFMAIEKARGASYDLMFVDAVMPGIDGIETLSSLREMLPEAMAVMITGSLGEELENLNERLEPLNAHVLRKPFEIPSILKYSRKLEKMIRESVCGKGNN